MGEKPRRMFKEVRVTGADILAADWLDVIPEADRGEVETYSTALNKAAKAAVEAGDDRKEQVFVLLAAATSMYYDGNDLAEPLKPAIVMKDGRSAALSDFDTHHLDPISEVYEEVQDVEMRARLADILWLRRKDFRAAKIAVRSYLERARFHMDPASWVQGFQRLQRAMQIAGGLGKKNQELGDVSTYAIEVLTQLGGNDPLYLSRSIVELLLDYKTADPRTLAGFVEKNAQLAEERQDWMVAADYWALVANCRTRAGDNEGAKEASLKQGKAQVTLGEAMLATGNPGLAGEHWVEQGFQTLRQAGASKSDQEQLMARLHELQKDRVEKLGHIHTEVPVNPKLVEHLNKVKGKSLQEAVVFWAVQFRPTTKEQLRSMVLNHVQSSPLSSIMPVVLLREDGKTDFQMPGLPLDGAPSDDVMHQHMWRMADMARAVNAWVAEYVRQIITQEHPWQEGCLDWLLQGNSFIPAGREPIYARAIRAGLEGDHLVCTHLLIPQLENSFRSVLNQNGALTTFLRQDGTQDEFSMNKIVESEAFEQVFGQDMAFELRGLLAERAGANLRNNVAHGLISIGTFYGESSIVLLPLTIFLLLHGIKKPEGQQEKDS